MAQVTRIAERAIICLKRHDPISMAHKMMESKFKLFGIRGKASRRPFPKIC